MRPYFALIKDSFRAALASNVLYLLLAVITLLLLVLAPLHVREILDWKVNFGENVVKPDQLAQRLVERGEDEKHPAVMRVWSKLKPKTQEDVRKWVEFMDDESTMPDADERTTHVFFTQTALEADLNQMMKDREFYDAEVWGNKRLNTEANELLDEGVENLSDERSRRLNRLLLASSLGGLIKRGSDTALELRYAIWGFWDLTFNVSHKQFAQTATGVVTRFFDWVLAIGLFVAILVTANIIPETFLPGSLNLLLSKPISRWGLLVAKFIGGCAYVSLCATYLFLGVWLWMGVALGVWEPRILWAIPLYIIVFAIYFAVSTLVGVWSRSQILAIVVTILFWAFCFGVGTTYIWAKNYLSHSRPVDLIAINDQVMHVGKMNTISRWDESKSDWDEELTMKMMQAQESVVQFATAFENADQGDSGEIERLGPVFDPRSNLIVAGMPDLADMGSLNHQDLYVSNVDNVKFREIGKLPRSAIELFSDSEGIISVDTTGKFLRLNDVSSSMVDPEGDSASGGDDTEKGNLISRAFNKKEELFTDISPKGRASGLSVNRVAYNASTRSITTLTGTKLKLFRLAEDGKYELSVENDVTEWFPTGVEVIVETGGDLVVLVLGNGQVVTFDESSLEHRKTLLPQKESRFKSATASHDGRYFVFNCYNKTVWLLDSEKSDSITKAGVSGQGTITAICFNDQNQLWVGNTSNAAQLYDLESMDRVKSYSPNTSMFSKFHTYCLSPFYWLCPKPGEFYKVIAHVSGASASAAAEDDVPDYDLSRTTRTEDPWQPLWSGLLFMFVTLLIACVIFVRRDF